MERDSNRRTHAGRSNPYEACDRRRTASALKGLTVPVCLARKRVQASRVRTHIGFFAVASALLVALLSVFLVARAVGVTLLEDPRPTIASTGAFGAVLAVVLLVVDAVLPVPSSLVMISLGALYGPLAGALLSVAGRFTMAVVGLSIGRAGVPVLVKLIGPARRSHAEDLVQRWGALAIIFSRPVPLLAETVVLAAGAARLPWRRALPAAFVGSLPEAVVYGLIGGAAASAANGAIVWLAFLAVGTLFRLFELLHRRRKRAISAVAAPASSATTGR
jgi:uncharacterized membrane protein YdjX (TVP38/TMEM64 family)